jgi:hypothetical protein
MTRWALGTLGLVFLVGVAGIAAARLLGRSNTRASLLVTVVAQWLGAFVLWNFAAGLLAYWGLVRGHEPGLFAVVALAGGILQYRTRLRAGPEPALAVFIGGQLLWLVFLAVRNGLFAV